jgi:hypothetical protein
MWGIVLSSRLIPFFLLISYPSAVVVGCGIIHVLQTDIGIGKEAGQHLARLQCQECVGGENNQVQRILLKISQEKHIQAHWRERALLLSELGAKAEA